MGLFQQHRRFTHEALAEPRLPYSAVQNEGEEQILTNWILSTALAIVNGSNTRFLMTTNRKWNLPIPHGTMTRL